MAGTINMFREFSMKHVAGYSKLSEDQKSMFDTTYRQHLSSLSIDEQVHFAENEMKKIEAMRIDINALVLKVYFYHGDCYFYLPGNVWTKAP